MNKKLVWGIVVVVLGLLIYSLSQYSTGEGERAGVSASGANKVNIDGKPVKILSGEWEFEGYAVGKSHVGKFDGWEGSLYEKDGKIVGISGKVNVSSVNTGIPGLDKHLKSADFFDVANYSDIEFTSKEIKNNTMTGNLKFRGVTKEVSFPVELKNNSISSEFFLDTTPFNMKYAGVNKEVRIKFSFLY